MKIDIGSGFQVRSYESGDFDGLIKYANNRHIWLNLRDLFPHPYGEEDANLWLSHVLNQDPELNFAIASETGLIGGVGLVMQADVHRCSAEIGYWLGEPFWGQGIATNVVCAITDYAFDTFDLVRIYAGVFETNLASARVLEKAGFAFEGISRKSVIKDGKRLDQHNYALLRKM